MLLLLLDSRNEIGILVTNLQVTTIILLVNNPHDQPPSDMSRFIELSLTMQQDQFGRLLPTFIQVIDLTEQEESEYWDLVSAVFEGRQVDSLTSRPSFESITSTSMEASINKKVCLQSSYYSESQLCLLQVVSESLLKII